MNKKALFYTILFGNVGVLHFVKPDVFDEIVPTVLPGDVRDYTYASGVAELITAGLIAVPKTRTFGGKVATALLLSVWPANIKMALDYQKSKRPIWQKALAWGRVPLQIPMMKHNWNLT